MAKSHAVAPLFKALGEYKRILISVGCFTALINLLMLVPSIYMLQVYDRVLSSQSVPINAKKPTTISVNITRVVSC